MTNGAALALHHPLDHVATFGTGVQAVPQVLVRAADQGWFLIVVEWALPKMSKGDSLLDSQVARNQHFGENAG